MKTKMLPDIAQGFYARMYAEGYGKESIDTARWIINHFQNYCIVHGLEDAGVPEAVRFVNGCFGFDYYHAVTGSQMAVRRPLLILFEFEECGHFLRIHQKPANADIPPAFQAYFFPIEKKSKL